MDNLRTMITQSQSNEAFFKAFKEREDEARKLLKKQPKILDSIEITGSKAHSQKKTKSTKNEKPDTEPIKEGPKPEKEWTVLCYIDGNNDLEASATYSMLDLESTGSNEKINVLAELGRISQDKLKEINAKLGRPYEPTNVDGDWSGIRRYYVEKDDPANPAAVTQINSGIISEKKDGDMSSPKELAEFLTWGIKNYPAKHYLVALMDHGGGWLGAFTDDASADGSHIMKPNQIVDALKEAEEATGKKPDVIDMVACLMASGEVAYEMKDTAKYLVASEEMGMSSAFMYSPIINNLKENITQNSEYGAKDLAKSIVQYYADKPEQFVTKSAIDLSRMDDVTESINKFAKCLLNTDTDHNAIQEAIEEAQNFSRLVNMDFYSHFRDLYGIAEKIEKSNKISDQALKDAAREVMRTVMGAVVSRVSGVYSRQEVLDVSRSLDGKELNTLIKVCEGKMETEGLSIYAPTDPQFTDSESNMTRYGELKLSKNTDWDEFLLHQNNSKKTEESSNDAKTDDSVDNKTEDNKADEKPPTENKPEDNKA